MNEDGELAWADGAPTITAMCEWQRTRAWQAAEFRKLVPDAFDETGTMKKGELARVIEAFATAHPTRMLTF